VGADLQAEFGHPVIGPLERPGRVDDEERSVERLPQRGPVVEGAGAELGPDATREVPPDFRVPADHAHPTAVVAGERLGNPAAEDPVTPEDAHDSRRVFHSGSTHPS